MIKAFYGLEGNRYQYLSVKGHADYQQHGRDLVCASVSSIMFGFMNAIDETGEDVEISDLGNQIIISSRSESEVIQNYFSIVTTKLKTIESSFGEYLKVERKNNI